MSQTYQHTLLLVDDEPSILNALKRLFRPCGYQILTAESGPQALDLLEKLEKPVSLIISDQRMPGMNGAAFLERSIVFSQDTIRFLLTGHSDMDAVVDAVNKGKIDRYLSKPWDNSEMLRLVQEDLKQIELKHENKRLTELTRQQNEALADLNKKLEEKVDERTWALKYQSRLLMQATDGLEKSTMESIRLLLSLVESINPNLARYMKSVGQLARKIAETAGVEKTIQDRVEMAGMVHDIGLLSMPEAILEKDQHTMLADEFKAYARHPEIAALYLSSVQGLKEISEIVSAHHENIDGSGFPKGIKGDEISIGSRILAVAADYCAVFHLWPKRVNRLLSMAKRHVDAEILSGIEVGEDGVVQKKVAEKVIIAGVGRRYDSAIVKHFLNRIGRDSALLNVKQRNYNLLKNGMVLAEDLRLKDGRLLLIQGTKLNNGTLQSITKIGDRGMIEGTLAVQASKHAI